MWFVCCLPLSNVFNYLYQQEHIDNHFISWVVIIHYYFSIFLFYFHLAPMSLWLIYLSPSLCFLSTFLLSSTTRAFRLILYISYPNLRVSHFFCIWKIVIKTNWVLGIGCRHFFSKWFAQRLAVNDRMRMITQVWSPEPLLSTLILCQYGHLLFIHVVREICL